MSLHDIDPEVNQVIQPLGRAIQVARPPIGVACEGSDVEFVITDSLWAGIENRPLHLKAHGS